MEYYNRVFLCLKFMTRSHSLSPDFFEIHVFWLKFTKSVYTWSYLFCLKNSKKNLRNSKFWNPLLSKLIKSVWQSHSREFTFQIRVYLTFCRLVAGWNLTWLLYLIYSTFSKSTKVMKLHSRWRKVFFWKHRRSRFVCVIHPVIKRFLLRGHDIWVRFTNFWNRKFKKLFKKKTRLQANFAIRCWSFFNIKVHSLLRAKLDKSQSW